ncbi:hypothetical protein [Streptomyces sp. NPDC014623]|uniref:hypothetical protein n=1 Tax=Streptomyces sp. NPDC014623 TaxID=3364875 RepID=UPI003700D23C
MRNTILTNGPALDGLACIDCSSSDTPQKPTGDRSPNGAQLFRCADLSDCSARRSVDEPPARSCVPWCTNTSGNEHEWCEGAHAEIATASHGAALSAYLFNLSAGNPVLAVYGEGASGSELDLAGADALIENVEAFLPQLRAMRQQLAESAAAPAAAELQ